MSIPRTSRQDATHLETSTAKSVFIAWQADNTRSATLAERFGARAFHLHALGFKRVYLAPLKYLILGVRTLRILARHRPQTIFVQNPPYFSALTVWLHTRIHGGSFILDSHTGAFLERKWTWLAFLHRFLIRRAKVSIVTNTELGRMVERWGGRYFVIADVPTEFSAEPRADLPRPHVTVINTFSYDEPVANVLEAASRLPDVHFSVTGDLRHCAEALREQAPPNVRFTGYIPMQEYIDTLAGSDAALVLTTENYTMQRGAYESVSLGVPVVTSDWPILRDTFSGGAVFCDNTSEGIADGVRAVLEKSADFKASVQALKERRRQQWADTQARFRARYLEAG